MHRKSLGPCGGPERSLNLQFENIGEFEVKFETNLGYESEGPIGSFDGKIWPVTDAISLNISQIRKL